MAVKYFAEKGEWAYPGTAQIFCLPPNISGTGKAMNFKFGQNIHRVHPNKTSFKMLEKREFGYIQVLLYRSLIAALQAPLLCKFAGKLLHQLLNNRLFVFNLPLPNDWQCWLMFADDNDSTQDTRTLLAATTTS